MAKGLHERIKAEREAALPEAKDVVTFREYYRGRHRGTQTRDQAGILRGLLGHLFCDNLCRKVITETAYRHTFVRFQVESDPVAEFLEDLVIKNRIVALAGHVAVATLRDGNHCLALRWQQERVTLHRERWWNGTSGIFVAYGDDGQPSYAVKDWTDGVGTHAVKRRIVWFPDHLERYMAVGDGWKPFLLPTDPPSSNGIVPWVKRDSAPLGIPIVHFAHGSDDDSPYGASDLDGGVLGVQDEINDIHRDITAAARLTGYQMYTATGTKAATDSAGNPKPLAVGPGQSLQSENADARYGVLPAGDLTQLKGGGLLTKIETICRMTDTPLHIITGEWPSGAALLRAEMPLVAKVTTLNTGIAPQWSTVAHRAAEMQNTFGEGDRLDEDALITTELAPPERLDDLTLAQIEQAKVSALLARESLRDESSLIALGMTEEDARAMLRRRDERTEASMVAARRAVDAGWDDDEEEVA